MLLNEKLCKVDPKILQFLILNGVLVVAIVIYIAYRPKDRTTRLKLRGPGDKGKAKERDVSGSATSRLNQSPGTKLGQGTRHSEDDVDTLPGESADTEPGLSEDTMAGYSEEESGHFSETTMTRVEKQLNIIFQFNGHSFDAHETLGIPAGCSHATAEAAYKKIMQTADPESREFYTFAYQAIVRK